MVLGLKVLAVLFVAVFIAVVVFLMPDDMPNTFNCIVSPGECMANGGLALTTDKLILSAFYEGVWQANGLDGF